VLDDERGTGKGKWLRYRRRNTHTQQEFTVLLKKDMRFPEVGILCDMQMLICFERT